MRVSVARTPAQPALRKERALLISAHWKYTLISNANYRYKKLINQYEPVNRDTNMQCVYG